MVWYSHLFKNFPQFVVIHTVKGFQVINETEVDVFLEVPALSVIQRVCMISHFSRVQLFVTPWTVACQAPLSMAFFRQEYWSGLQRPPPGDLSDPGIEPASFMAPVLAGRFFTSRATWKAQIFS